MVMFTRDGLSKFIDKHGFEIGEHSYGTPQVLFPNVSKLTIGKYCSIANGVRIFLGGNHRVDWVTTYPFSALRKAYPTAKGIAGHPSSKGDVIIGHDVWIGLSATILSGVQIGDGAVVGAESLVTKNVPPYAIVAGNPAKIIKMRFADEVIKSLLEIKWWDWPDEKVATAIPFLLSDNIAEFLERYNCEAL